MSEPAATTADSALPLPAPVLPALPLASEQNSTPVPNLPLGALDSLLSYQTPSIPTNGEPPCKKIYIGNLPETATLADLEDCFGQLGQCTCQLKRGFGFVDYTEASSALEAVAKYHEGHFLGAQIKVELSHAKSGAKAAPVNEEGKVIVRNPPGSDRPSDSRKPMHINGPPSANPPHRRQSHNGQYNHATGMNNPPYRNAPYNAAPRMPPSYANEFDRFPPPPFSGPPPPPRGDAQYGRYGRDDYRPNPPPPPPHQMNPYVDPRYSGEFDRYGPPRGPPQGYPPPRDRPYDPYYDAPRDYPVYGSSPAYNLPPPPPPNHPDLARLPYPLPPSLARDPHNAHAPLDPYYDYSTAGTPPSNIRLGEGTMGGGYGVREGYEQQQQQQGRAGSYGGGGGDRYDPRGGASTREERGAGRYTPYGRPEGRAVGEGGGDGYRSPRNGATIRRSLSPVRNVPLLAPGNGLPRRPVSPPRDYQPTASAPPAADEYNPRR